MKDTKPLYIPKHLQKLFHTLEVKIEQKTNPKKGFLNSIKKVFK